MSLQGRQPLHVAVQLGSLRLQARVGRHWSPGARGWAWWGYSYRCCGRSRLAFPLGLACPHWVLCPALWALGGLSIQGVLSPGPRRALSCFSEIPRCV